MFEYGFCVRGYELDSYGHVNNSVYLNYFEQARWEILRHLGLIDFFNEHGLRLIVTETHIRYSRELNLFDEMVIRTEIKNEAPYLLFLHKMYDRKTGQKACSSQVKTLMTDNGKIPMDIPEFILSKLK